MNNPMMTPQYRAWDPFALAREMMRWDPFAETNGAPQTFSPSFDILETEQGFSIVADLPGLREQDIDVTVTGNQVRISGERTREIQPENSRYHLYERHQGRFVRTFTLPAEANPEKVEASLDGGVLTLMVPKSEQSKSRRIPLKNGGKKKLNA